MTYKESFVEENPYITYTGEPETSFDGSGGSGGELEPGSVTTETIANGAVTAEKIAEGVTDSVYWITLTSDPEITDWEDGFTYIEGLTLDKSLSDIFSAILNGKIPKIRAEYTLNEDTPSYAIFNLDVFNYSETGPKFIIFKFTTYNIIADDEKTCSYYTIECEISNREIITGLKNIFYYAPGK